MFTHDVDNQIFSLANALAPEQRAAFEAAARAALTSMPPATVGEGSIHRVLRPIWRDHFRPPDPEEQQPAPWASERTRASGLIERDDPPLRCRGKPKARRMQFRGQTFRSRRALAMHLEPLIGKNAGAIEMALVRLNDDVEALVQFYAGKPKPK